MSQDAVRQCEHQTWKGERCRRDAVKADGDARWTCARDHEKPDAADLSTPRNSPCPCGSGVKFKKCCLDAITVELVKRRGEARSRKNSAEESKRAREELGLGAAFAGIAFLGAPSRRDRH